MLNFIKTYARDEDGAVTVDWVVLTAAIVGLAIAVGTVIFNSTRTIAGSKGRVRFARLLWITRFQRPGFLCPKKHEKNHAHGTPVLVFGTNKRRLQLLR
jgi:Flp pilus assembly pilin Flp